MTPITLTFKPTSQGRFRPLSRIAEELCSITGKSTMQRWQLDILEGLGFKIVVETAAAQRMLSAYRRPRFVEPKEVDDRL